MEKRTFTQRENNYKVTGNQCTQTQKNRTEAKEGGKKKQAEKQVRGEEIESTENNAWEGRTKIVKVSWYLKRKTKTNKKVVLTLISSEQKKGRERDNIKATASAPFFL